ncbi:MAG: universal stress protein [Nitrosomonadales bacterium]
MYKRVAVAIDGSNTSDIALEEAINLAVELGSTLLLLHVCEELPIIWDPDGMSVVPIQNIIKVIQDAGNTLLKNAGSAS